MKKSYLLDTNILLLLIRSQDFEYTFHRTYPFDGDVFMMSVVTEAELLSLSIQLKWGKTKLYRLEKVLKTYLILPIKTRSVIDAYAEIDAYSQGKLPQKPLPSGMSARNMGKNDLWIAATAKVLNAKLITTDRDFEHLQTTFLDLDNINLSEFN